ncbi:MAG: ABC transporter ATP-binding protein [Gammaproteobacteria bacterium]
MQLHIKQLSKALGEKPVLNSVELKLEGGQLACLLGASGCGKTTLLRCIAGFETVDAGFIRLDDDEVASAQAHVASHARGVGMVFQDHALFPHLSVAQNAAFGLHKWSAGDASKRVDEVLTLVGLESHAKRFPHQLSGGQQQRAALARALATRPKLLLLDEPFASLDRDLRYRLVQDVSSILRASGTTALWVTHDAREALQAADVVGVMRHGRIVQWDSPVNLYQKPVSKEVAMALGDCTIVSGVVQNNGLVQTTLGAIRVECCEPVTQGQTVEVLVRPEQLTLLPSKPEVGQRNALRLDNDVDQVVEPNIDKHTGGESSAVNATIKHVWFHGMRTVCTVVLDDGFEIKVAAQSVQGLVSGAATRVAWATDQTVAFQI